MIDNLVHIAHNVCIGDNTIIWDRLGSQEALQLRQIV